MRAKLAEHGMTASMSRKGNCRDNAPSESLFNSLKIERFHSTTYETGADAERDLFDFIAVFYNRRRPHSALYSSSKTGSASSMIRRFRRHENGRLEGEKRGAPHCLCAPPPMISGSIPGAHRCSRC